MCGITVVAKILFYLHSLRVTPFYFWLDHIVNQLHSLHWNISSIVNKFNENCISLRHRHKLRFTEKRDAFKIFKNIVDLIIRSELITSTARYRQLDLQCTQPSKLKYFSVKDCFIEIICFKRYNYKKIQVRIKILYARL